MPHAALEQSVKDAKHRIPRARISWSVCYGPAAAMVATCQRLLWKVEGATVLVIDECRKLQLDVDPPAVITEECMKAVRRWRWRRVGEDGGSDSEPGDGRGALMEPMWALLRSEQNHDSWNPLMREPSARSSRTASTRKYA